MARGRVQAAGSVTPEELAQDPILFADSLVHLNEKREAWTLSPYQRQVLTWAFPPQAEHLRFRTLLWSEPKKSGKTFIGALLALWWAATRNHTEVIICANSLDQAVGRTFRTMTALIAANPALGRQAKVLADTIRFTNGTLVTAIPSDYKSAAGSRHSLYSVDEPWAITTENAERLFEELTPPPSEVDAWGELTTTAGWVGESKMLEALYQRGLAGQRIDPELPLYEAGELFMFWSHEGRQPWQTVKYYAEQKAALREGTFRRLHLNEWVSAESTAIEPQTWDGCIHVEHGPIAPTQEPYVIWAVDAAPKHDSTAVVGVARDDEMIVLVSHRIWTPRGISLDFAKVEEHLRYLHEHYRGRFVFDPYQLHSTMMRLQDDGLDVQEYPQTSQNLTKAAETLLDLLRTQRLALYADDELRQQALNATVVESSRGIRITKAVASRKVDAIVALAMACAVAVETPAQEPARLWGRV
jgi:phage terminase large subunit-like protein